MAGGGLRVMMVTSEAVPFAKAGGLGDMVGRSPRLDAARPRCPGGAARYYGSTRSACVVSADLSAFRSVAARSGVPSTRAGDGARVPVYLLDHEGLYGPRRHLRAATSPTSRQPAALRPALPWRPAARRVPGLDARRPARSRLAGRADAGLPQRGRAWRRLCRHRRRALPSTISATRGSSDQADFPAPACLGAVSRGRLRGASILNLLQAGCMPPISSPRSRPPMRGDPDSGLWPPARRPAPPARRDLFGVLNGMDYAEWNPETDPYLVAPTPTVPGSRQGANKAAVQEASGWRSTPYRRSRHGQPAWSTRRASARSAARHRRLAWMCANFDRSSRSSATASLVRGQLASLARRYPNLGVHSASTTARPPGAGGQRLLPDADDYEPCGLTQMYSLRYGTLPIVRSHRRPRRHRGQLRPGHRRRHRLRVRPPHPARPSTTPWAGRCGRGTTAPATSTPCASGR